MREITSGEAYGGYRFYEHMDNPGAEPELDPDKAKAEDKRKRREAARKELYADAGGVPRYMADGRDYVKAQLVRAAEAQGDGVRETSAAGKTRDAWKKREEDLRELVPHDPERPSIEGPPGPRQPAIAAETAKQSKELRSRPGRARATTASASRPATPHPPAAPEPVRGAPPRRPTPAPPSSGCRSPGLVQRRGRPALLAPNPERVGAAARSGQ